MRSLLLCFVAVCVVCGGCQQPSARLNAPPHGVAENTSDLQTDFAHMVDNALLEDMSVSDVHFLPDRAALSNLGEERLSRLAWILQEYGGKVRLNTSTTDEELVAERIDTVTAFLGEQGVDTTQEVVEVSLPGGRGMSAEHAMLIKAQAEEPAQTSGESSSSMFRPTTTKRRPRVNWDAVK